MINSSKPYSDVTADEFFKVYDGVQSIDQCTIQLLDVRGPAEIQEKSVDPVNKHGVKIPQLHIVHSEFLVPEKVPDLLKKLESGKTVYVMCKAGGRSAMVCDVLAKQEGLKVFNIAGGITGSPLFTSR